MIFPSPNWFFRIMPLEDAKTLALFTKWITLKNLFAPNLKVQFQTARSIYSPLNLENYQVLLQREKTFSIIWTWFGYMRYGYSVWGQCKGHISELNLGKCEVPLLDKANALGGRLHAGIQNISTTVFPMCFPVCLANMYCV